MKPLSTLASGFEVPKLSPEEWAELNRRSAEHDRKQAEMRRQSRVERSEIPLGYRRAGLEGVPAELAAWAASPSGSVMLRGKVGRGKTWAACAALIAAASERTVRFATLRRIADAVRNADWGDDALGRYQRAGVLCIDDLGKDAMTEARLSLLFEVVKYRDESARPTIYTTNYEWAELPGRLAVGGDCSLVNTIMSRLAKCRMIGFDGPDRRVCHV